MSLLTNPFNVEKDIDELCDELQHENSSAETVAKLFGKIIAKGLGGGVLYGVALTSVALATAEVARQRYEKLKPKAN